MAVNIGGRECVLGIDVSVYQPNIDWNTVGTVRDFAVIKASGGDGGIYTDPAYAGHANASKGRLPRAAYHFLGEGDGAAQARRFLSVTNHYSDLELPPVVDFETYGQNGSLRPSSGTLRAFVDELHRLLGRRWLGPTGQPVAVVIYTGAPMAGSLYPGLEQYDVWLAAYMSSGYPNPTAETSGANPLVHRLSPPDRYLPRPWSSWSAWQFAGGDGRCPGVAHPCDQNVATVEWLQRTLSNEQEEDLSYNKWSPEEQWAEAVGITNLITGVDVPANAQGNYSGQRPAPEHTIAGVQDRLGRFLFQQTLINQAILKKLEIPFHMDQGAIVLDEPPA